MNLIGLYLIKTIFKLIIRFLNIYYWINLYFKIKLFDWLKIKLNKI